MTQAREGAPHKRAIVIVLIALLGTYGQTAIGILPLMIAAWVEGSGFSEATAGLIGSVTLAGMTLGLAVSVILLRYLQNAVIASCGIAAALLCDVASIFQHDPWPLASMRFLSGIGYGLVVASVVSWFARHEMADKCFGTFMLLQLVVFALLLTGIPFLEVWLGDAAPYLCLIVLGAASLAIAPLLRLNRSKGANEEGATTPAHSFLPRHIPASISLRAILAPGVVLIAAVGFWAFLQRFGVSVGIDEKQLGSILGVVTLSGIPASLTVIWLGNRIGRLIPVFIGLAGLLVPMMMFLFGSASLTTYVIGGILFTMAWSFTIPVMQAVQADLDDTGQLAALSTTPQAIGSAIGPSAFAMALGIGGYTLGFAAMIVLILISALVVLPATMATTRVGQDRIPQ